MTGIDNLDEIHLLEMRVNTSETSLGNFGSHVPNLSKLKLSNSIISSVRYSAFLSFLPHLYFLNCLFFGTSLSLFFCKLSALTHD